MAHHWGMAVDLDRCTGCGACVTACHAENNIPTVGPDEAARHRAMHWMRIERVLGRRVSGRPGQVQAGAVPAMRQRAVRTCLSDLCQPSHGRRLNAQVYNRCFGTRYCANACSYNVRFFNWSNPGLGKTPASAVESGCFRSRSGVMEKCTFCVQRINAGKIRRQAEERELKDGESSRHASSRARQMRWCSAI